MRRKMIIGSVLALLIIVLVMLETMSNPMRSSEDKIRDNLLEHTPVGTNMQEVIGAIESTENWELRYISDEHGYGMEGGRPSTSPDDAEVGVKYVSAIVGRYTARLIIPTAVEAFWGFDENSKLVDIAVIKYYDVL